MSKKDKLITELYKSPKIEEVLNNITKGDPLKEDLKSELFFIIAKMPYAKLKAAEEGNYLIYLCINILKKQYNSSTSPFHRKYRVETQELQEFNVAEEESNELEFEEAVLTKVRAFLNTLSYTDRELFKIYYKMDEYDRWIGEKRDTTCTKNISSSRKIERKLAINNLKGQKRLTIDHSTIAVSVKKTLESLREHLKDIEI